MTDDIYDPLDEYVNTFQPHFEQVAKDTFAQLAKEAQVDVYLVYHKLQFLLVLYSFYQ